MKSSTRIGERGQLVIPKPLRERFGLKPRTEVEFRIVRNELVVHKKPRMLKLASWVGRCKKSFDELGLSVDAYIALVRGR
jgi:AbrB family looped-hinge helix DNA binding protein